MNRVLVYVWCLEHQAYEWTEDHWHCRICAGVMKELPDGSYKCTSCYQIIPEDEVIQWTC